MKIAPDWPAVMLVGLFSVKLPVSVIEKLFAVPKFSEKLELLLP